MIQQNTPSPLERVPKSLIPDWSFFVKQGCFSTNLTNRQLELRQRLGRDECFVIVFFLDDKKKINLQMEYESNRGLVGRFHHTSTNLLGTSTINIYKRYNMKTIKLNCDECGSEFEKPMKEYKRSLKIGRKTDFVKTFPKVLLARLQIGNIGAINQTACYSKK